MRQEDFYCGNDDEKSEEEEVVIDGPNGSKITSCSPIKLSNHNHGVVPRDHYKSQKMTRDNMLFEVKSGDFVVVQAEMENGNTRTFYVAKVMSVYKSTQIINNCRISEKMVQVTYLAADAAFLSYRQSNVATNNSKSGYKAETGHLSEECIRYAFDKSHWMIYSNGKYLPVWVVDEIQRSGDLTVFDENDLNSLKIYKDVYTKYTSRHGNSDPTYTEFIDTQMYDQINSSSFTDIPVSECQSSVQPPKKKRKRK